MDEEIAGYAIRAVGWVQPPLPGLARPWLTPDTAADRDLHALAEAVLAADPDDAELALITRDRDERGYLTVGHLVTILDWLFAREPTAAAAAAPPGRCVACGRPLRDADSRRRGYGPVCWERVDRGRRSR